MRRLLISLLGFVLLGGAAAAVAAATQSAAVKPGLTVQIAPASQSITRGQQAAYTVSVTPTGGFTGTVSLAVAGLPASTSSAFSPASLSFTTESAKTSSLSLATTSATPTGAQTFTVTGTSGKVSGSVSGGLTVNAPLSGSLTMSATPASVTMTPGDTAVYGIAINRTNLTAPVSLAVSSGLPSGATASYSPNPITDSSSSLQITTKSTTPTGTYSLALVASGADVGGVMRSAEATVSLVITTSGKPFTLSGNLSGLLAPGVSRPLNVVLTNPNNKTLSITNLTVTVTNVTKASAAPAGQCTIADYAVTQYSGPYPLAVPANGSASLAGLVANNTKWPQVRMLNTAYNQDGCKGATVTLAYSGSGSGS